MKNNIKTRKVDCNVCGSKKKKVFFSKKVRGVRLYYTKCRKCGLLYTNPLPALNNKILDEMYSNEYSSAYQKRTIKMDYNSKKGAATKSLFRNQLDIIEKYAKKGKILDVGCGNGWFLKTAENGGWKPYGLEVSSSLVDYVKNKLKINCFNGTIFEAHFPENYFDVIKICHVIEHVDDPTAFLNEIHRIAKPGAFIVIETPNSRAFCHAYQRFIDRMHGRKTWAGSLVPPLHFYVFDSGTLKKLAKKTGFGVLKSFTVSLGNQTWWSNDPEILPEMEPQKNSSFFGAFLRPVLKCIGGFLEKGK